MRYFAYLCSALSWQFIGASLLFAVLAGLEAVFGFGFGAGYSMHIVAVLAIAYNSFILVQDLHLGLWPLVDTSILQRVARNLTWTAGIALACAWVYFLVDLQGIPGWRIVSGGLIVGFVFGRIAIALVRPSQRKLYEARFRALNAFLAALDERELPEIQRCRIAILALKRYDQDLFLTCRGRASTVQFRLAQLKASIAEGLLNNKVLMQENYPRTISAILEYASITRTFILATRTC